MAGRQTDDKKTKNAIRRLYQNVCKHIDPDAELSVVKIGGTVTYKTKCPKCGVDDDYFEINHLEDGTKVTQCKCCNNIIEEMEADDGG
jgi:hypothetical protein